MNPFLWSRIRSFHLEIILIMVILVISMDSRYQIQEQVKQGGVGAVFRAWDTRLQRTVALKRFLAPELRSDKGAVDPDLMREATMLSAMQHPNIVSIYDVLPDEPEGPCVIMEYLNGKDLEHAVAEAALTVDDFYQVARQTLDALSNAHRLNLLHRDIKPANIQVNWMPDGRFICKFVDFGLARFFEKPSKQTVRPDGTVMGSVYYMAPEQLERHALDGRADLYSLGCVFYFILSMQRPFEGKNIQGIITAHLTGFTRPLQSIRPQLPAELCEWVHWLMARRIEDRPSNASEALEGLQRICPGQDPAWSAAAPQSWADLITRIKPLPFPTAGKQPSISFKAPVRKAPVRSLSRTGRRFPRWSVALPGIAALLVAVLVAGKGWRDRRNESQSRTAAAIIAGQNAARTAASSNLISGIPPAPPTEKPALVGN